MKAAIAFCFLVGAAVSVWCQGPKGDAVAFRVEISVQEDSLKTDTYKQWGEFVVATKIKNISDVDQEIVVWTQQGWSWISNNPDVKPGTEAAKNVASKIALKPGEEFEGAVQMICDPNKNRPLTFRLGLSPKADGDQSGFGSVQAKAVLWSNAVALVE